MLVLICEGPYISIDIKLHDAKRKMNTDKSHKSLDWKYNNPFISEWKIDKTHIDHYQHTNNVAYLARQEALAWEHSRSLGLSMDDYRSLDRGMAIVQHELKYHAASHENNRIACATWIISCDSKFRLSRYFQFINIDSGQTVYSAKTQFVCIQLSTGAPKRMPQAFVSAYGKAANSGQIND